MADVTTIEELERLVAIATDIKAKADAMLTLAIKLIDLEDFTSAVDLLEKTMPLYVECESERGRGAVFSNLGLCNKKMGRLSESLKFYNESLLIWQEINFPEGIAACYNQIGSIYRTRGNTPEALRNYIASLKIHETTGNKYALATIYTNIGIIYFHEANYDEALKNWEPSLKLRQEVGDQHGVAACYTNMGNIFQVTGKLSDALKNYGQALEIFRALNNKDSTAATLREMSMTNLKAGNYQEALGLGESALQLSEELKDLNGISHSRAVIGSIYKAMKKFDEAEKRLLSALETSTSIDSKDVQDHSLLLLYELKKEVGDDSSALRYYERYVDLKNERRNTETAKQLANLKVGYELELKEKERQLIEKILFNVLPPAIASRIKSGEEKIIERFLNVTILFADIVGFTTWSEKRDVDELARTLDHLFQMFDELAVEHGIEKIKTIGDAYMCVAGLPEPCDDHTERICHMALAMNHKLKAAYPDGEIRLRTGIHTGEVIAGIIGKNKYAYDLWGDTVNTASRMESHSLPEKIQVTEEVVKALGNKFQFEERGEIEVKGKGRMKTWFLKEE